MAPAAPPRRFPWETVAGVVLALAAAWVAWRLLRVLDLRVVTDNFRFLILQGFLGIGQFAGGTLRLAVPAIVLGFALGIFVGGTLRAEVTLAVANLTVPPLLVIPSVPATSRLTVVKVAPVSRMK